MLKLKEIAVKNVFMTELPRNPYVTGYGKQIPTRYMVRLWNGRTYRVYAMCYSNAATLYVKTLKGDFIVDWL